MAIKDKRYEFRIKTQHDAALNMLAYNLRKTRPQVLHDLIESEAKKRKVWPG